MARYSQASFLNALWYWLLTMLVIVVVAIYLSSRESDEARIHYAEDGTIYRTTPAGESQKISPVVPKKSWRYREEAARRRAKPSS